jgi:hypothetical protein
MQVSDTHHVIFFPSVNKKDGVSGNAFTKVGHGWSSIRNAEHKRISRWSKSISNKSVQAFFELSVMLHSATQRQKSFVRMVSTLSWDMGHVIWGLVMVQSFDTIRSTARHDTKYFRPCWHDTNTRAVSCLGSRHGGLYGPVHILGRHDTKMTRRHFYNYTI